MKPKILVITPTKHIRGFNKNLRKLGNVSYLEDPSFEELVKNIKDVDAIFTNPNKTKIYLDKKIFKFAKKLRIICTASTGTNHINQKHTSELGIKVISLTNQRRVINKISSTAEHAFALTLSSLRNIPNSMDSVRKGEWDYEKFIGKQMNCLKIGVIGYGRLGKMYCKYSKSMGSEVFVYDPYKKVKSTKIIQVDSLTEIFEICDIISLHVHVNEETTGLIGRKALSHAKDDILIVNTSRGEIINEEDLVKFLKKNPLSKFATDVLTDEVRNRKLSPILRWADKNNQIIITPHIGGMTTNAQEIAYNHSLELLSESLESIKK